MESTQAYSQYQCAIGPVPGLLLETGYYSSAIFFTNIQISDTMSRYAGFVVLLYIFNDDKGSPVVVELFFILLLDVYSSSSGSQLIDWAEALAYILLH